MWPGNVILRICSIARGTISGISQEGPRPSSYARTCPIARSTILSKGTVGTPLGYPGLDNSEDVNPGSRELTLSKFIDRLRNENYAR